MQLLVLLSGFLGATMAPPAVAQRLHAVVVGDLSPSAGWGKHAPNITLDMLTMYVVLHENVPEDRLEYLPVSIEADEDSTPQLLVRLLDELHPKPNDTLLFYYTGHGAADDRGHYFALAQGPLYRDDLLNQLRGKGARLTVLLSDCCNARSDGSAYFAPAPRVNAPRTITPVFQSLFFEPRGVVDVNGSSPGESAFFTPETEASKTMPGSLFTRQLADWFTQQKRRSATWDQLLRSVSLQVHVAFRDGYPRGAEVAKGAVRQMDQNVYAVAYPGMPERSGPRTGLIVRDHSGHGALIIGVGPDSPGAQAFSLHSRRSSPLHTGQLIVDANGQAVNNAHDFLSAAQQSPQVMRLTIQDPQAGPQLYLIRLRY